ncbi:aspartate carbamoyltransferase regulatory chain [Clostridium tetani]|uniref:aspartate carbamoyltransferase regulatory subunit n=1 Tax=Clostridium tetani TaxID=1513 RepID=UPI00100AB68C|nr:aspartate carbamoyltransferase regulatory subunit [Clostridium tetani]RXM57526.1 aspartate carbamoyltransferase regulatory subunit [Clostridium tetani]RXM76956.1 aspartate carbamoyltransferase regulatory subunit [Clostridium tetani]RYU99200.1 aspartate carbamoyltransferase regulatory subunit [Clostridium tetani]BDR70730.1 aspartate carbamoyltransferase regulatory chain [Clostridium tetani]BDR79287.1 aspartate carbamoyltransferase regulatory chain [Clostridium tetani]
MLTITSIKDGIVIDHIKSGCGMKIFNYLNLKNVEYSVALIMNVFSSKLGKKDIIKIANKEIDIDFTVLGLIDPTITINIIEDEKIKEKLNLELPKKVEDVIRCKNPRCITSIEKYIPHVFYLIDKEKVEYKCKYCDEICKVVEE